MTIHSGSSIEDLAFAVCTALHRVGVTAVLSGGAASAVYAPKARTTEDLDFILQLSAGDANPSAEPVLALGFEPTSRAGIYRHPNAIYTIEFPAGPLAVGDEIVGSWVTRRRDDEILHIISPTDCVRDRLSAAIHWNDFDSIRQAAEVAKLHPVDLEVVRTWCEREGGLRQFETFLAMET